MTAKYFAILTNQGAARLANAAALGTKLNLTQMAVGDANGTLPTPDPAQTKLINQKRIAPLNLLTVDPSNTSQIIAEQIIPENEGGFWIREIGLYDDDGILIAVANCPETYKPQLQEGSGRTQTIRMILIVSSTSAITLKIDPAVVLATRQYVDDKIIEVKGYADDLMKKHVEAANPHKQYPLIANALKEMVDAGLAGDVLKNLGLGETINKASGAMQKSANGADISDVSAFRNALQLGTAATRDVGADNASKLLDLDSFRSMMSGNGYIYIPCIATTGNPVKLMLQWGTVATQKGADAGYALPFAFPYAGLFATGNRGTSGYNAAMNVRIASRTHISIQNWSPSGEGTEDCCFIALGY
ncbi:phage tail protein [Escherichia coli]|nr:phage tail protein [Escherichia coli]